MSKVGHGYYLRKIRAIIFRKKKLTHEELDRLKRVVEEFFAEHWEDDDGPQAEYSTSYSPVSIC
jgi:hemerythrin